MSESEQKRLINEKEELLSMLSTAESDLENKKLSIADFKTRYDIKVTFVSVKKIKRYREARELTPNWNWDGKSSGAEYKMVPDGFYVKMAFGVENNSNYPIEKFKFSNVQIRNKFHENIGYFSGAGEHIINSKSSINFVTYLNVYGQSPKHTSIERNSKHDIAGFSSESILNYEVEDIYLKFPEYGNQLYKDSYFFVFYSDLYNYSNEGQSGDWLEISKNVSDEKYRYQLDLSSEQAEITKHQNRIRVIEAELGKPLFVF
jgi:hypothetical protein